MNKRATARKTSALLLCLLILCGLFSHAAYAVNAEEAIAFTEEEQAVIRASQQNLITVSVLPSAAPECDYDAETGRFVGINMEVLRTVSERTGLMFDYLPIDLSVKFPVDWLKAGEFDLVAGILRMPMFINDPELLLSDTIMPDSIVMVGRRGEDFTKDAAQRKLAVMDGFQSAKIYVSEQFPKHALLPCNTIILRMANTHTYGCAMVLSDEEMAFYDPLTRPEAIKDLHLNDELVSMTRELTNCSVKVARLTGKRRSPRERV